MMEVNFIIRMNVVQGVLKFILTIHIFGNECLDNAKASDWAWKTAAE